MANNKKNTSSPSVPHQSLTFTLELYPEWSFFTNILSHLTSFQYAYILHDKDANDDGEIKKAHCHVVVKYGGYRTLSSVQNEYAMLGMDKRFVNTCNKRAMLRYLIHKDNPEKFQYKESEIKTNMPDEVELALKDIVTSEVAFYQINKYIEESDKKITQSDLNNFCFDNGYLKGLKAYQSQINNARNEHNKNYEYSNLIDRAHQNTIIAMHKKIDDVFGTALVSGFDEIEIMGHRFQIAKLPDKEK